MARSEAFDIRSARAESPHVAFVGHGVQVQEFAALAAALKPRGVASHFWAVDPLDHRAASSCPHFSRVVNVLDGFQRGAPADTRYLEVLESLRSVEASDGYPYWHEDAASDRHLTGLTDPAIKYVPRKAKWARTDIAHLAWSTHSAVLKEVAAIRPLAVLGETNTLPYRAVHRAARSRGVLYLRPETPGHLSGRVHFEDELRSRAKWCVEVYEGFSQGVEAPHEAVDWARAKLRDIRDHQMKPIYTEGVARGARRLWQRFDVGTMRRSLNSWAIARMPESRHSPRGVAPDVVSPLGKLNRAVALETRRRFYHTVTTAQLPVEKFACYFLHVQPEFSVEGLAFAFQDQVAHVRNIVAGLPADMVLVVKEHRPMAGRRSVDFYGELSSIPNVVIIDDTIDSVSLIKQAAVVFTLTGTVAIEAMCCGVPAIISGDIYYDAFAGIERASTISDIARLVGGPTPLAPATEAQAIQALAARYVSSYRGDFPPRPGNPENAALLADALIAELGRRSVPFALSTGG